MITPADYSNKMKWMVTMFIMMGLAGEYLGMNMIILLIITIIYMKINYKMKKITITKRWK